MKAFQTPLGEHTNAFWSCSKQGKLTRGFVPDSDDN